MSAWTPEEEDQLDREHEDRQDKIAQALDDRDALEPADWWDDLTPAQSDLYFGYISSYERLLGMSRGAAVRDVQGSERIKGEVQALP